METLLFLAAVLLTWQGSVFFQLDQSPPDGGSVYACVEGRAEFPWIMSMAPGDELVHIEWFYDGNSEEMVALLTASNFVVMPAYSGRIANNGTSLFLSNVSLTDVGNYTVEIRGQNASGAVFEIRRTARLVVQTGREAPTATGGRLQMTLNPIAVKDARTGDWHLQLSCGTFTSRGQPPVDVIWTTPSGTTLASSGYSGGTFTLLVPTSSRGGDYTCKIPPEAPAAVCLTPSAPVLGEATLTVDELLARLILLEARQTDLEAENSDLKTELHQLETEKQTMQGQIAELDTLVKWQVRLANGGSSRSGRVEIFYAGQWGTVCDDDWDSQDAAVVCGMLGYSRSGATAYSSAHYGQGSGRIWLDEVQCTGSESSLLLCPRRNNVAVGSHDCTHIEDAGVSCL